MVFKKISLFIFALLWLMWAVYYTSASFEAKAQPQFHIQLSNSIFLWIDGLNSNIVWYKSGIDISEYLPRSSCNMYSKFVWKSDDIYFYYLKYQEACANNMIVLQKNGVNIFSSMHSLKFFTTFEIYNKFTDYSTSALEEVLVDLSKKQRTLQAYKNINSENAASFLAIRKKRKYDEVSYVHGIIQNILESREYPYLIPIQGYELPTQKSHMPNFSRGYRKEYTDGIHHGWDIYAPNKTPVQAIDAGLIVRIVEGFEFSDLQNIKRGPQLTEEEKLINLDIHRGNQVWLKTMKGEVVFYSHLDEIGSDIEVWDLVSKGATLGTTWISWVPVRAYTDYHLHFAIQKNPYNVYKAWKYTYLDYMWWDWLLKWLSMDEVKKQQYDIFVK